MLHNKEKAVFRAVTCSLKTANCTEFMLLSCLCYVPQLCVISSIQYTSK